MKKHYIKNLFLLSLSCNLFPSNNKNNLFYPKVFIYGENKKYMNVIKKELQDSFLIINPYEKQNKIKELEYFENTLFNKYNKIKSKGEERKQDYPLNCIFYYLTREEKGKMDSNILSAILEYQICEDENKNKFLYIPYLVKNDTDFPLTDKESLIMYYNLLRIINFEEVKYINFKVSNNKLNKCHVKKSSFFGILEENFDSEVIITEGSTIYKYTPKESNILEEFNKQIKNIFNKYLV